MKLLLFSDVHNDPDAARHLVEQSRGVDIAGGAGDFAQMRRGLLPCIAMLSAIGCPTILVPGNNETDAELRAACASWPLATVLHGEGAAVGGVEFFGLGGAVPETPFGAWSFDLSEDDAAQKLAACPRGAVLVSHSPPFGAVDVSGDGTSRGSQAVRRLVEEKQPRLVVCGHVHASWEQQVLVGETMVVNAGPGGVVWDLSD